MSKKPKTPQGVLSNLVKTESQVKIPGYEELCKELFRAYVKDVYNGKMDLYTIDRWICQHSVEEICTSALELADGVLFSTPVASDNVFRLILPYSPRELDFMQMSEEDLCTLLQTLRFWKRYTPAKSPSHLQEFFDRNESFRLFSIRENIFTLRVREEFEILLSKFKVSNDILHGIPLPDGSCKGGTKAETDIEKLVRVLRTDFEAYTEPMQRAFFGSDLSRKTYSHETSNEVMEVPKSFGKSRIIAKEWPETYVHATPIALALERCIPNTISDIHDAEPSRNLAQRGSIDNSLVTVDQSAASDSISVGLADFLFSNLPEVYNRIWAVTSHCTYRKKTYVRYNVLCTMGNRVTFILLDLINCAMLIAARNIYYDYTGQWYDDNYLRVYGDDVIAPPPIAKLYIDIAEALGFTINEVKTCDQQNFYRESCGGEYYRGHDISSTYLAREYYKPEDNVDYFSAVIQLQHKFFNYPRSSAYLSRVARALHPKVTSSFPGSDYDDLWTLVPTLTKREGQVKTVTIEDTRVDQYGFISTSTRQINTCLSERELHTVIRPKKTKVKCEGCVYSAVCAVLRLQRSLQSLEIECSPWSERVSYYPCVVPELSIRELWF